MTTWRSRLATLRAECPTADSANSADRMPAAPPPRPNGAIGANGIAVDHAKEAERQRAAFYRLVMAEAAEALAAPDPELDHERAEVDAALAAEARGDMGQPLPAADHQRYLAALRGSALQRPPSWADHAARPSSGCWCSCCRGRWWWAAAVPVLDGTAVGPGWCCATCHPAPPNTTTIEVRT